MKRARQAVLAWIVLVVLLGAAGPARGAQAAPALQSIQLRIANRSGLAACSIYITMETRAGWGADRLGSRTLPSGQTAAFPVQPGKYKVRVEDCNAAVLYERHNLSLIRNFELAVTSPLQRRNPPPSSVARQLGAFSGGAGGGYGDCEYSLAGLEYPEECTAEITDELLLYFADLLEDQDGQLVIRAPDGSQQKYSFHNNYFQLFLEAGAPLGRYSFVAAQGGLRIEGFFDVALSSSRAVEVTGEPPLLIVHLAGFEPGETFPLHIYRDADIHIATQGGLFSVEAYIASLDRVEMDGRGEAQVRLPISPSDPAGYYTLIPGTDYDVVSNFFVESSWQPETSGVNPLQTCGRATVIGDQDLPVWKDPAARTRAGAITPGRMVDLLCVKSVSNNDFEDYILWTFIRSGALKGWVNSDFLELDEDSLQFRGFGFG